MSIHQNIVRIKAVNGLLGDLQNNVVYVGGSIVALYADGPTVEIRPTDDVDILLEIWTRKEYAT